MQEDWVSTSDIYKLLSDSQRKQFTKMLSYQKDFADGLQISYILIINLYFKVVENDKLWKK